MDVSAVATRPSTATAAGFTLSPNRTLTFPANTTDSTGTVTLTADDDDVDALRDSAVRVTLTNPQGVTIPTTLMAQTLTITDDEDAPTLTLML